jgi:hypothetical protein
MAGATYCALYWGKFPGGGVGEGEVNSGTPVGVVPANQPRRKGKFLCRHLLEGDCVRLAVVWGQRVGCIVECELDAPFDSHRHGFQGAAIEVNCRVPTN